MTPYEIARLHIGLKEIPGDQNHPDILAMYARVGHGWVEHEEVAWCAAFVDSCLEQTGERSTRSLTARSYLDWGVPVELSDAREGDIVVLSRGTSSWQGHVGFYVGSAGREIEVLGGNQNNAVSIASYARDRLLGLRRAGEIAPSVALPLTKVQTLLGQLGYHEVGRADGIMGPRTKGAILAFRAEHDLPLHPIVDQELITALMTAQPRFVSGAREHARRQHSRRALGGRRSSGVGRSCFVYTGLETARVEVLLPWIGAAVFAGIILYALKARAARIEDHRSGRTP